MSEEITAQQIIDRIKNKLKATWKESSVDVLNAGTMNTLVSGIATSYTPTIEVLKKAVATRKNLIITQQPAFYKDNYSISASGMVSNPVEELFKNDPTYLYKKDYIEKNKLVLWRFYDNWNAREVDGQLLGLAKALGWDKYHIRDSDTGEQEYHRKNHFFLFPEISLSDLVLEIRRKLNIKGLRLIGDPDLRIKKAALSHGMLQFTDLQEILKDPDVDLIVVAEAIEWESPEYFRDLLTMEKKKGMIILGREATEDPGYGEVASWLKTFITEIPIEWIPAKEPFWIP